MSADIPSVPGAPRDRKDTGELDPRIAESVPPPGATPDGATLSPQDPITHSIPAGQTPLSVPRVNSPRTIITVPDAAPPSAVTVKMTAGLARNAKSALANIMGVMAPVPLPPRTQKTYDQLSALEQEALYKIIQQIDADL